MEDLLRINKELKDRNDELEFCFETQTERGRYVTSQILALLVIYAWERDF